VAIKPMGRKGAEHTARRQKKEKFLKNFSQNMNKNGARGWGWE
jgi:hypothetical protein